MYGGLPIRRRMNPRVPVKWPWDRVRWAGKSDAVPTRTREWSHMVEWTGESGNLRSRLRVSHPYLTGAPRIDRKAGVGL